MQSVVVSNESFGKKAMRKTAKFVLSCMAFLMLTMNTLNIGFAGGDVDSSAAQKASTKVQTVLKKFIGIVGLVFQAVGVVLAVYSVGQLVLAIKNEDADSKSRAATMLVVGVVLIALPAIIDALDLVQYVTGAV